MGRQSEIIIWLGYVLLLGTSVEAWEQDKSVFSANKRIMDRTLRVMNKTEDPCGDFEEYAMGKYGSSYDLYTIFDFRSAVLEKMDPKFLALFEKLKCGNFERGSLEEKALKLYSACERAMEKEPDLNYAGLVQPDVNLTWPDGTQWPGAKFDWLVTLGRLRRFGMDLLFRMSLELDHQETSKYMISLGSHDFVLYELYSMWVDVEWLVSRGFNRSRAEFLLRDMNKLRMDIGKMLNRGRFDRSRMTIQQLESEGFPVGKYLEIVFARSFPPNFVVLVDYLEYLVKLNQIMLSYDPETVAIYLMQIFDNYMRSSHRIETFRQYDFVCVRFLKNSMKSVSYLLYEEHFLGQRKVKEFDEQVQRVFEAIRKEFKLRLDRNRLNLTASHITSLRKILGSITVSVGNVPKSQGYRRYLTDVYSNVNLEEDDDLATIHLKVLELETHLKLQKLEGLELTEPYPGYEEEAFLVGNGTSIVLPLPLMEEPFFTTHGHDVFKVSLHGFLIAKQVLSALFPHPKLPSAAGCQKYNELVGLFDDLAIHEDHSGCISPRESEMTNWRDIIVVLLNIVQDAYFSEGSGFEQTQPSFTEKPLKQLFYLHFAQNQLSSMFYYTYKLKFRPFNPLLYLPTFVEAFNCSIAE
ncbi:uncharacterized protein LOC108036039 [Drosophila biarmipes]|uniref:uncharacterized protein LOC108036039 n=1 Tax=Drosophila biarmipes TaxID=125945 RepID=UPI0021CC668B|nr:uncharacterized protein LOC108036039 [Drosophila biarmipes]